MAKRPRLWRRRRLGVGWEEHSSSGRKLYHTWAGRYIFSLFFFFCLLHSSTITTRRVNNKKEEDATTQRHPKTKSPSRPVIKLGVGAARIGSVRFLSLLLPPPPPYF